jgi:hypothetical protein
MYVEKTLCLAHKAVMAMLWVAISATEKIRTLNTL